MVVLQKNVLWKVKEYLYHLLSYNEIHSLWWYPPLVWFAEIPYDVFDQVVHKNLCNGRRMSGEAMQVHKEGKEPIHRPCLANPFQGNLSALNQFNQPCVCVNILSMTTDKDIIHSKNLSFFNNQVIFTIMNKNNNLQGTILCSKPVWLVHSSNYVSPLFPTTQHSSWVFWHVN